MTKRQKLDYNSDELIQNLKFSAGHGVDALFSPPPSKKMRKSTPTSQSGTSSARSQTRKAANSQSRGPAKSQSRQTATSHDRKVAKPLSSEAAKLQDREPLESQSREAAPPRSRSTADLQQQPRKTINHGLTIFEDQLLSLKEIQLDRQKLLGKKYCLGDLVKAALDMFITKERSQE